MRRVALLALFAAAPLLRPVPVMAAHIAAPLGFTLSCNCSDPAGQAYASAIRELLRKDSAYAEANLQPVSATKETASYGPMTQADPVHIQVISAPVLSTDGTTRVDLTVRYTHGDRSMEQRIQTCAHGPLGLAVALLVHDFKQLEAESADPLTPDDSDSTIVMASLRK